MKRLRITGWLGISLLSTLLTFAQSSPRRYALLVGVGNYQNPSIPTLAAPPNDVELMQAILTDSNGYGFRKEDVVTLCNEAATVSAVREAFKSHLIAKAQPEDVVLFYFSGHGSQTTDTQGDEVDHLDETLILHDSRTPNQCDWVDDDLNQLLAQVKAKHLVVILDACHSGTGTRGNGAVPKKIEPADCPPAALQDQAGQVGAPAPARIEMLAVSDDGKPAFEEGTTSIFTQALANVLTQNLSKSLTYRQLEARVKFEMIGKDQIPFFGVPEDQKLFNTDRSQRPFTWLITEVKESLVIAKGLPMPGWSEGGQALAFGADADDEDLNDPKRAKSLLQIQKATQGTLFLQPVQGAVPKTLAVGDLLVLEKPGHAATKLRLHLRPSSKPGGLSAALAAELAQAFKIYPSLEANLALAATPWEWEIALDKKGDRLEFLDSQGRVRNSVAMEAGYAEKMAELVSLFVLQQYLMTYAQPEESPNDACSLKIELVRENPAEKAKPGPAAADLHLLADQSRFQIKVTHPCQDSCVPLHVGLLALSADGSIYAWPEAGQNLLLKPGLAWISEETIQAAPPFGINDYLLAIGSGEGDPVAWHRFIRDARDLNGTRTRGDTNTQDLDKVRQTRSSRFVKASRGWTSTLAVIQVHE